MTLEIYQDAETKEQVVTIRHLPGDDMTTAKEMLEILFFKYDIVRPPQKYETIQE